MESYVTVMFLVLFVFLSIQPCSFLMYFFYPWQAVQDTYIQDDHQSWWCSAQLQTSLSNDTFLSIFLPLNFGFFWCVELCYLVSIAMDHETLFTNQVLQRRSVAIRIIGYVLFGIGNIMYSGLAILYAGAGPYTSILKLDSSGCVIVQEDQLLLGVWWNSEWNNREAWLKYANVTSVIVADNISWWFVAVSICCFVGCIIMVVLLCIDYDPVEDEEPPEAQAVNIDTD